MRQYGSKSKIRESFPCRILNIRTDVTIHIHFICAKQCKVISKYYTYGNFFFFFTETKIIISRQLLINIIHPSEVQFLLLMHEQEDGHDLSVSRSECVTTRHLTQLTAMHSYFNNLHLASTFVVRQHQQETQLHTTSDLHGPLRFLSGRSEELR